MKERTYRHIYRVHSCRPGAEWWAGSRFYVMRGAAERRAARLQANGWYVEIDRADLGPFAELTP